MQYIFHADDDQMDRDEFQKFLLTLDGSIEVKGFSNGLELMQGLGSVNDQELPSIIMMDLRMPIWDGVRTLQALQSERRYSGIKKLMWSISDSKSEMDLCLRLGAEEFCTKPASQEEWNQARKTIASYLHAFPLIEFATLGIL